MRGAKEENMGRGKIDHSNTVCCICGGKNTYIKPCGDPVWFKDRNEFGIFTGKYICKECYDIEQGEKEDSHQNKMKGVSQLRNNQLKIDGEVGKGLIGEAVVANVRGLKICNIEENNFNSLYDLTYDIEYGIIQVKFRQIYYGDWIVPIGEHNFDTLCILCADKYLKNIKKVYMIPERIICQKGTVHIYENPSKGGGGWYQDYMIDEKPYNSSYQSLMLYLKGRKYFGIKDIQKWMEL